MCCACSQIHQCEPPGDILVFLTGEQEIEEAKAKIEKEAAAFAPDLGKLVAVPLYSTLPPQQQQRIFSQAPGPTVPGGKPGRKVGILTGGCQLHSRYARLLGQLHDVDTFHVVVVTFAAIA